ncbi:aminoglycoside 3'-phosphotransferase [Luteimicrobium subarcticum]|uniref:Kanamycin kinase n=1 Tax=Luteimicrobium subarcticum TaxID=620910 RepID=A0A2M8WS54_9MICO|nr:aminoglycoside 3'-phosphotransferase [Luteimicrobium subarcticum]PJI93782.1 kanamycin kinase [Luteimicrobium subarcticum]
MSRTPLAAVPHGPVVVPEAVRRVAGGSAGHEGTAAAVEPVPVWRNEAGGLTFRLGPESGASTRYVKWAPVGAADLDLAAEAVRLRWASPFTPVPPVLDAGEDADGSWLVTAAVPGASAVDPVWLDRPRDAVRAIGEGLRALHDALPVDGCPFGWGVDERLARSVADGVHTDAERAAALRARAPDVDRLVVCHGDACAPNTLLTDDGRWSAHVDLGRLGVADRWADLAVATWSTQWNYGPGWEDELLAAYGVAPDPDRTAFYRELWDAT